MKVHKMVCIDYIIAKRLQEEDNASALINALLLAHYKDMRSEEDIIQDVKNLVKIKDDAQTRDERIRLAVIKRTKEMSKIPFIKKKVIKKVKRWEMQENK